MLKANWRERIILVGSSGAGKTDKGDKLASIGYRMYCIDDAIKTSLQPTLNKAGLE